LAMPATSRYWTSAGTFRWGLKISVSLSSRSSGTFTVARFGSSALAPNVPVWASERVRALKTVVFPELGGPMMTSLVATLQPVLFHVGAHDCAPAGPCGPNLCGSRLLGRDGHLHRGVAYLDLDGLSLDLVDPVDRGGKHLPGDELLVRRDRFGQLIGRGIGEFDRLLDPEIDAFAVILFISYEVPGHAFPDQLVVQLDVERNGGALSLGSGEAFALAEAHEDVSRLERDLLTVDGAEVNRLAA